MTERARTSGGRRVFICYARPQDNEHADNLYKQLTEASLKPWMDRRDILPGEKWDVAIQAAIKSSSYFLVVLTKHSVDKRGYLQKEIKEALDVQKEKLEGDRYVIPVRVEQCRLPDQLSHLHCADLFEVDGLEKLKRSLLAGTAAANVETQRFARVSELSIAGIKTPCFFPSVSGAAKNSLSPLEHIQILIALEHPAFLVSAYDIVSARTAKRTAILRLLRRGAARGQVILLDSGLYERKWLHAERWSKKSFHKGVTLTPCHFAFCYDDPTLVGSVSQVASAIAKAAVRDQKAGGIRSVVPIVHAKDPKRFPSLCVEVARRIDARMLAVPERELGAGIVEAAKTVTRIRSALNDTGQYYPIHILGAGNPLSILVYSACGADSFDGLDWCQTVVDHATGRLYHTMQLDFFANQTPFGATSGMSYFSRAFAHNLFFYKTWMSQIQKRIADESLGELLRDSLPSETMVVLKSVLPSNEYLR